MTKEKLHTVIRLPSYHCQYNAIELIWAQVKGHATRHNTTPSFTANKIFNLLNNACEHVTSNDWKKVVDKTRRIITEDWQRDVRFDYLCDQELIINLEDCFSDSVSDDDDCDLR
ncbi:unnamed protein product [Parnassius mnemosyne]|uniref:Tc1-like transposase DDE domain-containing protein n=1 Tax=Parnassius mnemosyne TaxID=213953 RepID=A0AAV1KBH7_9NEOP